MEKAKLLTSELMVFETKDGVQLKLTGEDVQEIATRLMVKMVGTGLNYFYVQSTAVEKCKLLYQIVTEQRDKMSDEVREQYLKGILEFLKDGDIELTSLKDKVEKQKPQPNFNQ